MTRLDEPTPAVPLEYETERPRSRRWTLVLALIAISLAIGAVLGVLVLGIGVTRTTITGPVVMTTTPQRAVTILPAPSKEQARSQLLPMEGERLTLKQRESRWLPGGRLKLAIDDITGGQVLIAISDDAGNVLLPQKSVREGDVVDFADPANAPLRLEVLKLTNHLIGDDFGEFRVAPAAPATQPAEGPAAHGRAMPHERVTADELYLASYVAPPVELPMTQPINLPLPTLGGKQLWTDLRISADGWRIQRHALTGHCRLLDDRDRRQAWGTEAACRSAWERLHADPPPERRAGRELVVLLHGLGRTRAAMRPMGDFVRAGGFDVIEFGYASTRGKLDEHAEALAGVLAELQGYERVHFVGHSLGALVVRRQLATRRPVDAAPAGRVVMLAPPNSGSSLAARLGRNPLYLVALGPIGQEIAEWKALEATLATPEDFAVIAGDCESWSNPLLDSAGDLVVTVEETKLDGMREFRCVDATHTFMMRNAEVMRMTLSFLRSGRFE